MVAAAFTHSSSSTGGSGALRVCSDVRFETRMVRGCDLPARRTLVGFFLPPVQYGCCIACARTPIAP